MHTYYVKVTLACSPISFPEAAILLVSDGDRDLWPRPLTSSNTGSQRFKDFPSLCACSQTRLTNLISSGLNLLCLPIHSRPECCWTWPWVPIFQACGKRDPWDEVACSYARSFCRSPLHQSPFYSRLNHRIAG